MAPCLRCRMLRSSDTTADNGFREQGDLLQVPRRRDSLVALEVRNWITPEIQANMAPLDILAAVPMETFAAQIYAEKQTCGGLGFRE